MDEAVASVATPGFKSPQVHRGTLGARSPSDPAEANCLRPRYLGGPDSGIDCDVGETGDIHGCRGHVTDTKIKTANDNIVSAAPLKAMAAAA